MFTIYFNEEMTKYEQIYHHIIKEIKEKRLLPEEKLPSRRTLARHLGVSLNTVIAAYDQLLEEGYIISKPRSGYFVDKISADQLDYQEQEIVEKKPIVDRYRYNFHYDGFNNELIPVSILKRLAAESVEVVASGDVFDNDGYWELKQEIQNYLQRYRGIVVPLDQIIITSGYRSGLLLLTSLMKNQVFAMEDPGYRLNETIFTNANKKLLKIPIDQYGFSVADLEKTKASVAITTPSHQFPTGMIMGVRRRQRLLNWAYEQEERYVIEDDFDSHFKYTGQLIPSLKSLDTKERVILLGSFSQVMGSFLRISYLVLPKELKEELDHGEFKVDEVPLLSQITLQQFLKKSHFSKYMNRVQTHYRKVREAVLNSLKDYPEVKVKGASAGLYFVLEFLSKIPPKEVIEERMKKKNIFIEPVDTYRIESKRNPKEYILGFGNLSLDEVEESVQALMELFTLNE